MTLVVSFWGGPGSGKSTTAAAVFAELKNAGVRAELVFEYVKSWAWESRTPSAYDEFHIFGEQVRRETLLYGKVDVLLTDRPLRLSGFYARQFGRPDQADALDHACSCLDALARADGHSRLNVWVPRKKAYDPGGRYQTEAEARAMDKTMRNELFGQPGMPFVREEDETIERFLPHLVRHIWSLLCH